MIFSLTIIIILIGVIISKDNNINELQQQIVNLRYRIIELEKQKKQLIDFADKITKNSNLQNCEDKRIVAPTKKSNVPQRDSISTNIASKSVNTEKTINSENVVNKAVEQNKLGVEEQKNVSILITGSILVVLSAIVFLTTAWNSIPDIIKTVTLFLFVGIFLGASKIAKEKFHLEKAGKTFFYIAMAYLPICFLSISIFGLFGEYLSITGGGKYLYLGSSCVILAILYYFISKNEEKNYLLYGSILSQLLSVILFSLLFEERVLLCCVNLLLYNLLLIFMTKDEIFKIIRTSIPIVIAIIVTFGMAQVSLYSILACILLAINFLCLELERTNEFTAYAFNFYLLAFGSSLIFKDTFNLSVGSKQILLLLYLIPIFIIEHLVLMSNKNRKNILSSSRVLSTIVLAFIYLFSIANEAVIIPSFIVGLMFMSLLIICFKMTRQLAYKYIAYTFINALLLDINYNLLNNVFEFLAYIPLISSIIVICFESLYSNTKDTQMPVYLCVLESVALITMITKQSVVSAVISIIYVLSIFAYNRKNKIDRSYNISLLILLLPNICGTSFSTGIEALIMILLSLGLTYLSISNKEFNMYTVFSVIYLILGISNFEIGYLSRIIFVIWAGIHLVAFTKQTEQDIFRVCIIIGVTSLYYSVFQDLSLLNYTIFSSLGIIIAGFLILKKIIIHYINDTEALEYVFWAFIYLSAIPSYNNPADGVVFSLLILGIIFFSYCKGYGEAFLAGILAILGNAFILTRTFWLSIPWWIYLLAVGGSLIGFAIKNEASSKKVTLTGVLKSIRESCEK